MSAIVPLVSVVDRKCLYLAYWRKSPIAAFIGIHEIGGAHDPTSDTTIAITRTEQRPARTGGACGRARPQDHLAAHQYRGAGRGRDYLRHVASGSRGDQRPVIADRDTAARLYHRSRADVGSRDHGHGQAYPHAAHVGSAARCPDGYTDCDRSSGSHRDTGADSDNSANMAAEQWLICFGLLLLRLPANQRVEHGDDDSAQQRGDDADALKLEVEGEADEDSEEI